METSHHFIHHLINTDLENGSKKVITRFPPEPNGYLHIGHAKSICLNFETAIKYQSQVHTACHLRFDDTNPKKENVEFINSIKKDIQWLGFKFENHEFYTSNYFDQLYQIACDLITADKAFVCGLSPTEIREHRGSLTEPGKSSPFRNRPSSESLSLLEQMKKGNFEEGEYCLRAKIDMTSNNLNLRDPVLYRIIKSCAHPKTGTKWNIYPTYDFAHCLSDAIEGITHSICTLEFEDHRPLYNWLVKHSELSNHPQQIEFARLNLSYQLMSKRKLKQLVDEKVVTSWSDPRMPTIAGFRNRGYTPQSIREFCNRIGVAKRNSQVDMALLEFCIRNELNQTAPRMMAVLNPIKVVIENYPKSQVEILEAINNPEDPLQGKRSISFSREIYIERSDFLEDPPKKFFRLSVGKEVRLRYAYWITCTRIEKDNAGNITTIFCTYDPATKGNQSPDGRKVKGTLHWVSASDNFNTPIYLYDNLFQHPNPSEVPLQQSLNPNSLKVVSHAKLESYLKNSQIGDRVQFERIGYFYVESTKNNLPVFNRIVGLKDTWGKIVKNK